MKYVFEALSEQRRIPLSKVTWDKVEPIIDPNRPKWYWQKDTVDMPYDYMSSNQFKGHDAFENWYRKFVEEWGTDGELVETRPTYWKLEGNKKWDEAYEKGSKAVSQYYDEKKSGDFTGD